MNCGNMFRIDAVHDCELVTCSICEVDFKVVTKDVKVQWKELVCEGEDFGELQ